MSGIHWKKIFRLAIILIFISFFLAGLNLNNKKTSAATWTALTFKGKIFDTVSRQPLAGINVLIDNDVNSSFNSDTAKSTVTQSDGTFVITVPSRDYNQLYISSTTQNNPDQYFDLRGFISWTNDMVSTWQSNTIEANILLKPGWGVEYVQIIPLINSWNHIATPLETLGQPIQQTFTTVVIENNKPKEVALDINNKLWEQSNPSSYTIYCGPACSASFGSLERYKGYWYDSPTKATLVIKGKLNKEDRPQTYTYQDNTLIGNPWGGDYSVQNILIYDGSVGKTYSQALQENIIQAITESYNPLWGYPQGVSQDTNLVMKEGRCYWINLLKPNLTLVFPSPFTPSNLAEIGLPSNVTATDMEDIKNMTMDRLSSEQESFLSYKLGALYTAKVNYAKSHYLEMPKDLEVSYNLNGKPFMPQEVIDPQDLGYTINASGSSMKFSIRRLFALGTPPVQSGNLKIYFAPKNTNGQPQWTADEKTALENFRNSNTFQTMLAKIMEIGGPFLVTPKDLADGKIVISVTKTKQGDGFSPATYENLNGQRLISIAYPITDLGDLKTSGAYSFLEELIHSMKVRNVRDSRVEEARANANLQLAYEQLGIAYPNSDLLPWYEQRNREVISPQKAGKGILGEDTNLTSETRYDLASAAFKKIYYEDKGAFIRYIKNLAAKNNTVILPSGYKELKKAVKTVERQNLDNWLDRQYGLGFHSLQHSLSDYAYVGLYYAQGGKKNQIEHDLSYAYLGNRFESADGRYHIQGYKTYTENGNSVTAEFLADTGTLNTAYLAPTPDSSQRYTRFTWLLTVDDLNMDSVWPVRLLNPDFRLKPPWSHNVVYSGWARPYLWGIIDQGHSGRVEIAPIDPATGQSKAVFKSVAFQNGVFDSDDPTYGQKAGTYEIRYYTDTCDTPIKRIITKPAGEYYVLIETKGKVFNYLAPTSETTSAVWSKFQNVATSSINEAEAYGYCEEVVSPQVEHLEKTLTGNKLTINFDTLVDAGGYISYTRDDDTKVFADFSKIETDHGIDITGLMDGKMYPYQTVSLTEINQMNTKDDDTFTNFTISNITSTSQTTSAVVTWNTSANTKGIIEYGKDTNYGMTKNFDTFSKTHSLTLDNLGPDTAYRFRIKSATKDATSRVSPAQTLKTSFSISNIKAKPFAVSAVISWQSNALSGVSGEIDYGETNQYGQSISVCDSSFCQKPDGGQLAFGGLKPDTTYHYRLRLLTSGGPSVISEDYTFTTSSNIIFNRQIDQIGNNLTFTWETVESSTGLFEYTGPQTNSYSFGPAERFNQYVGNLPNGAYSYQITATLTASSRQQVVTGNFYVYSFSQGNFDYRRSTQNGLTQFVHVTYNGYGYVDTWANVSKVHLSGFAYTNELNECYSVFGESSSLCQGVTNQTDTFNLDIPKEQISGGTFSVQLPYSDVAQDYYLTGYADVTNSYGVTTRWLINFPTIL